MTMVRGFLCQSTKFTNYMGMLQISTSNIFANTGPIQKNSTCFEITLTRSLCL